VIHTFWAGVSWEFLKYLRRKREIHAQDRRRKK